MDSIPSYLKWTIGVILTLIIIGSGVLLLNRVMPVLSLANEEASVQVKLSQDSRYAAYDYQIVSGSKVLTAMRQYYDVDPFTLYVQIKSNGSTQNFGMTPSSNNEPCRSFDYNSGKFSSGTTNCRVTENEVMDVTSTYYIPPQARFRATVVRDDNDRISAIYFKQQD